jgi:hypothetical protein
MVAFGPLWTNISDKRARKIREEVIREVRDELITELTPVIRDQVREEIWDEARDKAREEAHEADERVEEVRARIKVELTETQKEAHQKALEEIRSGQPTERERQGFVDFVKETELDAHAQATVASGSADRYVERAKWSKRLLGPMPWLTMLGALPLLYLLWQRVGAFLSVEFIGAAVFLALVWLILLISNAVRHGACDENSRRLYRVASNYLVLAEKAKSFRLVHAERLDTKARLTELTQQLRREKVDLDDKFHPRIAEVEEAKESVRQRISVEDVDPFEDFDERLEDAEESVRVVKA